MNKIRLLTSVLCYAFLAVYKFTETGETVGLGKEKSPHSLDFKVVISWGKVVGGVVKNLSLTPTRLRGIPLGQQDHNPPKPPYVCCAVKHLQD